MRAHNYVSLCFYQLLDYDILSTYSVQFINNSAAKGGDHIYGVSLTNRCIICAFKRNKTHIRSYEVFCNIFLLNPGYNSSLSAVSADASFVCICDNNGEPRCGNDSTIVVGYLQVYPGEQFPLHLVVVGGDYGTTTGNVYTSFLNESSSTVLGFSSQQYQVITKNSECRVLNFSVYSNKS